MTLHQGIHHDIESSAYHADPCPKPSLSASIAKIIWQESPKHAWENHPRLNPDYAPTNKRVFDLGSASHAVLLEHDTDVLEIIYADDYRTKKAKAARDQAYLDGRIPALEKDVGSVLEMVDVAQGFIVETELLGIFDNGKPEATVVGFSSGFWKRCRVDWLPDSREIILDYKTTGGSSKPESWIRRQLFPLHYDIQAYVYPMMVGKVEKIPPPKFVWLVQENTKPYACSLVGASPGVIESGRKKWEYAVHKWKWCIEHNKWPSHDSRIHWAEVPAWSMAEVEERGE